MNKYNKKCLGLILIAFLVLANFVWSREEVQAQQGNTVNLSGSLSGTHDYTGQNVVIGNVTVVPYNGSSGGSLTVIADNITVNGIIDASGAGYGGGGGGAGGPGASCNSGSTYNPASPGSGGRGVAGGLNGSGSGSPSTTDYGDCGLRGNVCFWNGGNGGSGGRGGGIFPGNGGGGGRGAYYTDEWSQYGNTPIGGGNGSNGGYKATASNGDSSIDESLEMGSGGGGGGGMGGSGFDQPERHGGRSGYSGAAGGRGGGYVKLIATNNLIVSGSGKILASGKGAGNGYYNWWQDLVGGSGSTGGHADVAGDSSSGGYGVCWQTACYITQYGGQGGSGAGGGVLLKGSTVNVYGMLDTRGSNNNFTNGGTIKIRYCQYSGENAQYYSGRNSITQGDNCQIPDCSCAATTRIGETCTDPLFNTTCNGTMPYCAGSDPAGSTLCPGDDSGLLALTDKTLVDSCTPTKCEYTCNSGYTKVGSMCMAPIAGTGGEANGATYCEKPPTEDLCNLGTPTEVTLNETTNQWEWNCQGLYGGSNQACSATKSCAWREVSPN